MISEVKLNSEDKEELHLLMSSNSWKKVEKLLALICKDQANRVLTLSIDALDKELFNRKAMYQGMDKLIREVKAFKKDLIKETDKQ